MLTILSIIVMLTIPLFHCQIAPLHRPDEIGFGASEIVIANNTTIGISGFKSNYYLNDNITIQTGRKLTLLDLNLYIQVKEAIITDYGTLCMINTSVHMYSGNESLGTEILGSSNANANLTLENSSWLIPGFISLNHSIDKISDSSLASAFSAPANQGQTLSMTVVNSTLIAFNSSFAGLMHARPINQIDAANLMYSRNTPFSSDADIPLTSHDLTEANPLVTRIRVNMTYSGNNPTGENTLYFIPKIETVSFDNSEMLSDSTLLLDPCKFATYIDTEKLSIRSLTELSCLVSVRLNTSETSLCTDPVFPSLRDSRLFA